MEEEKKDMNLEEEKKDAQEETPAEEAAAPAEGKPKEAEKEAPQEEGKAPEERKRKGGYQGGRPQRDESGLIERVIKINRVSKVVKGGKNFSFSALVVTGDGDGSVGYGLGKSNEVVEAIKKGTGKATRDSIKVNRDGDTIPHEVIGRFKASHVIMKPAAPGTGVIAGGPVRAMCDAAGIKNILTKTLGSRNAVNVVKATRDGFEQLRLKRRG